jgi:hypothetical protein
MDLTNSCYRVRRLAASLALGVLLSGCDIESARILAATLAETVRASETGSAPVATSKTPRRANDGGSKIVDPVDHDGHRAQTERNRPDGQGFDRTWQRFEGSEVLAAGLNKEQVERLLQASPWFGRHTQGQEHDGQPACQDGKCPSEPKCYPGTREEFDAEQAAIAGHPLETSAELAGKWVCASGQGYLKLSVEQDGKAEGVVVFFGDGQEVPMMAFHGGTFASGTLSFGETLAGRVGQISADGPLTFTAAFRSPEGERLARFTREAR